MKPAFISPCKLACFPSQHNFNEKLQRKAPHLRASGFIYEFGPEGRAEANSLFTFYHSHSLDGSRNLPFSGICMQVLSDVAFVYVAFNGVRKALRATCIQFPHNSPQYPVIGEAITKTSRCHVWFLLYSARDFTSTLISHLVFYQDAIEKLLPSEKRKKHSRSHTWVQ